MTFRAAVVAALILVAARAHADTSVGAKVKASDAPPPLAISARYAGHHRFRIRITNRSRRPLTLLFAWRDQMIPESPFYLSFDLDPPQSLHLAPPRGPRVRTLAAGASFEFVTEPKPIVGNEYEPRVVYDSGNYLGEHCPGESGPPCYLTTEQCPECEILEAESPIIQDWPHEEDQSR